MTSFSYSAAVLPFVLVPHNLRPSQVWLLLAMQRREGRDVTVQWIADMAGVSRTIALNAAAGLAEVGFAKKQRTNPAGRRVVAVLTNTAKRHLKTIERPAEIEAMLRRMLCSNLPRMTLRQLWVLLWLYEAPEDGPVPIAATAAELMCVDRTVTSRIINALSSLMVHSGPPISAPLVARYGALHGDKRASPITLTDGGRRWVESVLTDLPQT